MIGAAIAGGIVGALILIAAYSWGWRLGAGIGALIVNLIGLRSTRASRAGRHPLRDRRRARLAMQR
jgi:hypothetical protein